MIVANFVAAGAAVDLLELTRALVDVESVSYAEGGLADRIEADLRALPHLSVTRVGDNVVARTVGDRSTRLILAGHTDTVPVNRNFPATIAGDVVHGVGTADMKGGLAVMLASAVSHSMAPIELTYVFYAREEVRAADSGLGELFETRPELLRGDLAILGEPTAAQIEAGCQGTLRLEIVLRGARAHSARPWTGRNAIHRSAAVIEAIALAGERRPVLDGCEFRESTQVVGIDGGVAPNVVPDEVTVVVGHRFAPDRDASEAERWLRSLVEPHLEDGDGLAVVDVAPAAQPAVGHPLVRRLIEHHGLRVSSKLGWTDVARFSAAGVPAINLGPGDPLLAHTRDEHVTREQLDATWSAIDDLVRSAARSPRPDGSAH